MERATRKTALSTLVRLVVFNKTTGSFFKQTKVIFLFTVGLE